MGSYHESMDYGTGTVGGVGRERPTSKGRVRGEQVVCWNDPVIALPARLSPFLSS